MSSIRTSAKINSFIQRKLATIGDATVASSQQVDQISGIDYEAMALPGRGVKK